MSYTLHHGNCLDIMPTLEAGSVDVVITDPPYGLGVQYSSYDDSQEQLVDMIGPFIGECRRMAGLVVVFPGINNIWAYPKADWVCCWFYGTTGSWGKMGYNSWQPMLIYGKNNRRYGMDTIKYSTMEKRYPGHPCPKPIGLMNLIVERFSEPDQTVLDCFMGSGTTGVACANTGRNFIGIEMDAGYFGIASRRVAEAYASAPNATDQRRV